MPAKSSGFSHVLKVKKMSFPPCGTLFLELKSSSPSWLLWGFRSSAPWSFSQHSLHGASAWEIFQQPSRMCLTFGKSGKLQNNRAHFSSSRSNLDPQVLEEDSSTVYTNPPGCQRLGGGGCQGSWPLGTPACNAFAEKPGFLVYQSKHDTMRLRFNLREARRIFLWGSSELRITSQSPFVNIMISCIRNWQDGLMF